MLRGPRATCREVPPAGSRPLNLVTTAVESQRATRYCQEKSTPASRRGPEAGDARLCGIGRLADHAAEGRAGRPGRLRLVRAAPPERVRCVCRGQPGQGKCREQQAKVA